MVGRTGDASPVSPAVVTPLLMRVIGKVMHRAVGLLRNGTALKLRTRSANHDIICASVFNYVKSQKIVLQITSSILDHIGL